MKNSTYPPLYPLGMLVMTATLGVLVGCSSQSDKNAETLAQTSAGTFAATPSTPTKSEFNPYESRNTGAWGGVYMTEEELNEEDRSIVDFSGIPSYAEDPELTALKEKFGEENAFASNDGQKIYHDSCAGCHMHKGEGAYGAGYYPPLANNSKMDSEYYIIDILINGFRGMPSFRSLLNDEQMAAVTQYVMNDLNGYDVQINKEDVAQLRPAEPPQNEAVH